MCGIVGCVGRTEDPVGVLTSGLSRLEYRGYDSAGIAVADAAAETVSVVKRSGELDVLLDTVEDLDGRLEGSLGIGHTRWSTHGPPTDENAHPHTDCGGRVAVVHNGIIENYHDLVADLEAAGHVFESETDTEVVPHLVEGYLDRGYGAEEAFRAAVDDLEGSYAVACVVAGVDALFAARNDSPLVVGVGGDGYYLGSDVPAFLAYTDRVVYLDDGELATMTPEEWVVTDADGTPVEKSPETVDWDLEDTGKSGYDHYMLKEINEQPVALRQTLSGRIQELSGRVDFQELASLDPPDRVQFVACGTSYHAGLYAARLFRSRGVPAQALLAHEYALTGPPSGDALVVGVTQSGETADTLSALRTANRNGATTLALTNVVGSSATRECDHTVLIRAGPEIGVAATKTFSSQLVALNLLAEYLLDAGAGAVDRDERLRALRNLPGRVQQVLDESTADDVAGRYLDAERYFFIGRGLQYPVALEGALKFKEITYEHAEGFAGGELKHGTLSLVDEETVVFAVVTGDGEAANKILGNVKEVGAREASVVVVGDGHGPAEEYADAVLPVPPATPETTPVLANLQLQLVAYHVADRLGRPIDKPRHLAKSVTVE
jgi:glucosamine--fructose-6-phosphate aminotransferase (isomerizing)